jgi:hypothetical protein
LKSFNRFHASFSVSILTFGNVRNSSQAPSTISYDLGSKQWAVRLISYSGLKSNELGLNVCNCGLKKYFFLKIGVILSVSIED